jgi:hypothetical protein
VHIYQHNIALTANLQFSKTASAKNQSRPMSSKNAAGILNDRVQIGIGTIACVHDIAQSHSAQHAC